VEYAAVKWNPQFQLRSEAELALIDAAGRMGGGRSLRAGESGCGCGYPSLHRDRIADHKFGVDISEVEGVYDRARSLGNLSASGVSCHIGSQLLDTQPVMEAVDKMLALIEEVARAGHQIRHLDLGGRSGVAYKPADLTPQIGSFIERLKQKVQGTGSP